MYSIYIYIYIYIHGSDSYIFGEICKEYLRLGKRFFTANLHIFNRQVCLKENACPMACCLCCDVFHTLNSGFEYG